MSISGMQDAWSSLEGHARTLREQSLESLLTGEPPAELPEELAEVSDLLLASSERLRREGDSALRKGESYERVATLMLATTAVDAMVARDLAALDPAIDRARLEAWLSEQRGEETTLEEDAEPGRIVREGDQLLDEVARLFAGQPPPNAGRSPGGDRATLISEVEAKIEGLGNLAAGPAKDFAGGLVNVAFAGLGDFLTAVVHIDVLSELERAREKASNHAPLFLREHVAKIATLRSDSQVLDEMAKVAGEQVEAQMVARGVVASLLGTVSGSPAAIIHAGKIDKAPEVTNHQAEALLADLTTLHAVYSGQMHWIGKSALWLRRGARLLVHLGTLAVGPFSYAIGAGVFFVGFGYVGYSLADRIDAQNLGFADRVEGIVRLVDRHIPPGPIGAA